jgi:hypothetical protein
MEFKGVVRPNRKHHIGVGPFWVESVELEGSWMEFILWDNETVIARGDVSLEFNEPVYSRDLYITITGEETCKYRIIASQAQENTSL